eukprot:421131-Rhodomonas_salina.2
MLVPGTAVDDEVFSSLAVQVTELPTRSDEIKHAKPHSFHDCDVILCCFARARNAIFSADIASRGTSGGMPALGSSEVVAERRPTPSELCAAKSSRQDHEAEPRTPSAILRHQYSCYQLLFCARITRKTAHRLELGVEHTTATRAVSCGAFQTALAQRVEGFQM